MRIASYGNGFMETLLDRVRRRYHDDKRCCSLRQVRGIPINYGMQRVFLRTKMEKSKNSAIGRTPEWKPKPRRGAIDGNPAGRRAPAFLSFPVQLESVFLRLFSGFLRLFSGKTRGKAGNFFLTTLSTSAPLDASNACKMTIPVNGVRDSYRGGSILRRQGVGASPACQACGAYVVFVVCVEYVGPHLYL